MSSRACFRRLVIVVSVMMCRASGWFRWLGDSGLTYGTRGFRWCRGDLVENIGSGFGPRADGAVDVSSDSHHGGKIAVLRLIHHREAGADVS